MKRVSFWETRIPPDILFVIAGLFMKGLAHLLPSPDFPSQPLLAVLLLGIGAAIVFLAIRQFGRQQTTVSPRHPERSSTVVTTGIYRYSRNPMYLGMAILLLSFFAYLGALSALLPVAAFVVFLTQYQIKPEERTLKQKFGQAYEAYCRQTRRWL